MPAQDEGSYRLPNQYEHEERSGLLKIRKLLVKEQ
jgi:hypothetical protein